MLLIAVHPQPSIPRIQQRDKQREIAGEGETKKKAED